MAAPNVLILFSDEHRRDAAGCYGHPMVQTPHLDRLAEAGTRFTRAYTPSPICVPARAALATGQYVHRNRCWSNAQPWSGEPRGWGHALQRHRVPVESIGKLHYRGSEDNNGFDLEHMPLHVKDGIGWIKGLLRDHESVLDCAQYAKQIGPGQDTYSEYDNGVTESACRWIGEAANTVTGPWALFVSWLRPHYPLTCPAAFYDLYPVGQLEQARFTDLEQLPGHPVVQTLKKNFDYDSHFTPETRQVARASYYGLCSFLDHQVGRVLDALDTSGQRSNTLVIYTSDHGDHNGDRGMWTKMSLFDESSGVPLLLAGPGIPAGKTCETPASLIDLHPTILAAMQIDDGVDETGPLPGMPLQELANREELQRYVLSEYHDGGSPTGMFMLRDNRWKYNVYPGYPPELYDMREDADELDDRGSTPSFADVRERCHAKLTELVDPERANALAFSDQARRIADLGGVDAILASQEYDFTPVE